MIKAVLLVLVLLALASGHRNHGPPGKGPSGKHGEHKLWKQRCMNTNSLNTKFDLTPLRKGYQEDPFTYSNGDLSVSFSVCGRNQKLEECGSIGACISFGDTVFNGGGVKKEFIDTLTTDTVSFVYSNGDFCDVIGGNRWKTIITIASSPDKTAPFQVTSVELGNCTVRIFASSSSILANEGPVYEDDDDGEHEGFRKRHMIWLPVFGAALLCFCVTCCCCAARRRCRRNGSRWCEKPAQTTTTTEVQISQAPQEQYTELESHPETTPVLSAIQPPPMYPQFPMNPQANAPFYPAMYYYPQVAPAVNAQPVVPRESQIDSDEKLAKALQDQINKGAL